MVSRYNFLTTQNPSTYIVQLYSVYRWALDFKVEKLTVSVNAYLNFWDS